MTTLDFSDPPDDRAAPAPRASAGLRLRRREPSVADGFVDGAWWPRSLDLSVELPPLLAELSRAGHDVARVSYDPAAWNPAPGVLAGPGRPVTLDGSARQAPASVSLADISGARHTELVVIAPHTDPHVAQRVLALARLGGDLLRAVGMIERANRAQSPAAAAARAGLQDPLSAAVWETDGGRVLVP
ncbi:hypothetical protein KGA66_22695 [Actinocrinis puniceicyclus]|uniref:Uncharacterized protein n=1 Tax=Actinocrinis puniceicyclus TaxID=977794 RepID=A0A8J8BES3_9ACTN|nr:DUF5994 family protein [Actinocrinis puniceicyclus]MBS2965875.1 hypothetical protein [Actinocrinis puniceicyclus]